MKKRLKSFLIACAFVCSLAPAALAVGRFAPVVTVLPACNPTLCIQNPNPQWMHVWISNGDECWIPPAGYCRTSGLGQNIMYGKTYIRWEAGVQRGLFPVFFTGDNCDYQE